MNENNITNINEAMEINEAVTAGTKSGGGVMKAVFAVAGVIGTGYGLIKLGAKALAKHKANKEGTELKRPDEQDLDDKVIEIKVEDLEEAK